MDTWQEYEIRDLIRYIASRARRSNRKMVIESSIPIPRSVHLFGGWQGRSDRKIRSDEIESNLILSAD